MAENVNEDSGVGRSVEESANGQHSQSGEAVSSTSPPYWDTDEDDDNSLKPSELFGKHRWKIENFSKINEREVRSSLLKLVATNGISYFIHKVVMFVIISPCFSVFQTMKNFFQIHYTGFWKKEHDWGWKKFMELHKLKEGFIDNSDSLTIDAQVQVIRERVDRPFRCLDCAYRRELVRVYLSDVEQICQRFVEERRTKLGRLIDDKPRWTSFSVFWLGMDHNSRLRMSREKMDVILKGVVKHFFRDNEVTSTLLMDSLYSGLKALEGETKNKRARPRLLDAKELPAPIVSVDKDMFVLVDDGLLLLKKAALEPLPPKDEKIPQNRAEDGNDGEEGKAERDERWLTELGRRIVEIYVLAHIFSSNIVVAYQEAIALKRQEELIREEEEAAANREKKSKKKQV